MKPATFLSLLTATLLVGCGPRETANSNHDHDHDHDSEPASDGHPEPDHESADAPAAGATFVPGQGVILAPETLQSLGLGVTAVTARPLPNEIALTVQVFGEKHRHPLSLQDHSGCDVHGSALLPAALAATVQPGQNVQVLKSPDHPLQGIILAVQKGLALGESEVVIGVSNATTTLMPGEFVPAIICQPRRAAVPVVPRDAVLRTATGTFVYVATNAALLRTAVQTGATSAGWVEITSGLSPGSLVATSAVQTLWLTELRATKGGGHSH